MDFLDAILEWMRNEASHRSAEWIGEAAGAARAHPYLFWTTLAAALLALVAGRTVPIAVAVVTIASLTVWLLGKAEESDAAAAAAVIGWTALLAAGLSAHLARRGERSLLARHRLLKKDFAETKRLLAREIEWRKAGAEEPPGHAGT